MSVFVKTTPSNKTTINGIVVRRQATVRLLSGNIVSVLISTNEWGGSSIEVIGVNQFDRDYISMEGEHNVSGELLALTLDGRESVKASVVFGVVEKIESEP